MSFDNSTTVDNNTKDIKLNLNQSTIDLLNAAIASHSQTQLQQVQEQLLYSSGTGIHQQHQQLQQIHQLQQLQKLQLELQQLQKQQDDEIPTTDTIAAIPPQGTNAKRTIDSTDESDANLTTTPKRPGRKPLEKAAISDQPLDPKQKRKAQNRAAQRAFRERKEKHVSELQERIRELEALSSKADEALIEENNKLKEQLKKLEEENYALKDAKFTFKFPLSDKQQQQQQDNNTTTTSPTTTSSSPNSTDLQEDVSSSSSSTEQSPLSLAQEDDSDTPTTVTNYFQDVSPFATFGSIPTSQDFDFLAVPGTGSSSTSTPTSTSNDFKDLFQTKNDLFTTYRAPSSATTTTTTGIDDLFTDDNFSGGLPALFGGADDLFGFSQQQQLQQQQQQHSPLLLDTFYMPSDPIPRPHVRKETLAASLQRSRHEHRPAYEIHQQIKNCPDFDLDGLCSDLKEKANCSESKYVLSEYDVEAYLKCFGGQ